MLIGETMAIDKIVIPVETTTNGTLDRDRRKSEDLRKSLEGAAAAASKIGGTKGSRAVAAGYSGMSGSDYNTSKGVTGTGAGGRDFAKEARGLDGLVRVYATFAANLFAAGAAFRALSDAADTTNMIKGLDQLSASSGQALGSLSKQLAAATGGAISMREAMEATTKGSAAGLNSDQILKMGEVAKKASQALGVNMTDAMSRLSRGISKLEPELLDELGIYTKLDKATNDYARSVGKTASSLTDFEKRQAFANAVLKEGTDKFSNIKLDANPYDRLLATMKDVGQAGLELVNKVFGPIAEYLSKSPTALTAVFAGIATLLLSKALPAIANFRGGLRESAKEAEEIASRFKTSFGDVFQEKMEQRFKIPDLKNQVAKLEKDLNNVKIPEKLSKVGSFASLYEAAKAGPGEFQEVDKGVLRNVNDLLKKRKALLAEVGEGTKNLSNAAVLSTKQEISSIEKTISLYKGKYQAESAFNQLQDITDKKHGKLDPEVLAIQRYTDLRNKAAKAEVVANASQNAQIVGVRNAWAILNQEIEDKGITGVTKYTTKLSGGLAAVGSRLSGIVSAFGMWGQIIGAGITAFSMFDSWVSANNAELEKFKTAMEGVHDAGALVENVLKTISESGKGFITVDSIIARANAFNELSLSITKGVQSLQDADIKANVWDKFIDGFKTVIGTDLKSTFEKEMSLSISRGLDAIIDPQAKKKLASEISEVLGTSDLSYEGILAASKEISSDKIVSSFKQIDAAHKRANLTISENAKNLKALGDTFIQLETSYQNVVQSLALSDPLAKFGSSLLKVGIQLGKAFQDPINAVAELNKLLADNDKLSLLPQGMITDILATKKAVDESISSINSYQNEIEASKKELAEIGSKAATSKQQIAKDATRKQDLEQNISTAQDNLATSIVKLREFSEKGNALQVKAINEGLRLLERAVTNAQKSAAIAVQQTLLTGAEGPAAAAARGKLAQDELNIQIENIKATTTLAENVLANRIALEKNNALLDRDYLSGKVARDQATPEEVVKLENVNKLLKDFDTIAATKDINKLDMGTLQPGAAALVAQTKEMTVGARAQVATIQGKKKTTEISTELDIRQQAFNVTQKILKLETDIQNLIKSRSDLLNGTLPYLNEIQVTTKNSLEDDIAYNNITMKNNEMLKAEGDLKYKISLATGDNKVALQESLDLLEKINASQRLGMEIEESIRQIKQKMFEVDNKYAKLSLERETAFNIADQNVRFQEQRVNSAKELLDVKTSLSLITDADAEKERNALEISAAMLSFERQALKLQDERDAKLEKITADREKALAVDANADVSALDAKKKATEEFYTREKTLLDISNAGKMQAIYLNQSQSDRMKGFSKIVEDSFGRMGDALAEFAQTGKLDFKSLIDSLIMDLLRFELRAQMSALYKGAGGLSGMLGMLGFGSAGPNFNNGPALPPVPTGYDWGTMLPKSAKGNVFDAGLQKFAQGGMFTNSIVSSPTLFKFAQGTGLMGEAGPEAIMPLKRDSNGNLGVRANQNQPSTQVVVNNYGSEKATTKETKDSKGNRKIEVIIGDMVAQEVNRSGSATQQAMGNTFGNRPALARR